VVECWCASFSYVSARRKGERISVDRSRIRVFASIETPYTVQDLEPL
jgi:hypothetical protein